MFGNLLEIFLALYITKLHFITAAWHYKTTLVIDTSLFKGGIRSVLEVEGGRTGRRK